MTKFITRAYNSFEVNPTVGTITKVSKDSKLEDEIKYLYEMSTHGELRKFFPTIYNYGTRDDGSHFAELEYLDYPNLADQLLSIGNVPVDVITWEKIADQLTNILSCFQIFELSDDSYADAHEKMYVVKTLTEYDKLKKSNEFFTKLTSTPELSLNGVKYKNFEQIKDNVVKLVRKVLCTNAKMNVVHGDFCFGNILANVNLKKNITSIRLIDPRGSWGQVGIYGDFRYDIAKLYHSFEGCYEYLTNDRFTLSHTSDTKYYLTFFDVNMKIITKLFETKFASKFDTNPLEYRLIEGLIFVGMCARHYDSKKRQIAMYLTGIKLLNEVLENYNYYE